MNKTVPFISEFTVGELVESKQRQEVLSYCQAYSTGTPEVPHFARFSIEHAIDPVYWIAPDARIIYANHAACRSLGYSKDELLAMSVPDIDPLVSAEKWPNLSEQIYRGSGFLTFRSAHRRKDGTTFQIEVSVNIVNFSGSQFSLVFVKDISEREQAEKEKQRLEELLTQAQKGEEIGLLAGGIAHDFNNILAAIIGYTELARNIISQSSPAQRHLEQILESSLRGRDLVQQILSFSRPNPRHGRTPIEINTIMKEAVCMLRTLLPSSVEIHHELSCEKCVILADPTQIHQVLVNLCTNSAHATENKQGVLKIRLEEVEIDSNTADSDLAPGRYARITVSDNGCGMNSATVERIFDPFFTTKAVGKGSGLGLAVVQRIVKRHGGSIKVESEEGVGSKFQIHFPCICPDTSNAL